MQTNDATLQAPTSTKPLFLHITPALKIPSTSPISSPATFQSPSSGRWEENEELEAAIMSVSISKCFSDLLCQEDSSGVLSGESPGCSSDLDCTACVEESIAALIEDERHFVPGYDYLSRFQSPSLDAAARLDSVAWILKVRFSSVIFRYVSQSVRTFPFITKMSLLSPHVTDIASILPEFVDDNCYSVPGVDPNRSTRRPCRWPSANLFNILLLVEQ